jgi:hypothetical protein
MSIYSVSTLGTSTNQIGFNGTTFPIYRVISRAPQSRQMRDLDIPIPFESGATDFLTLEGSSAYVIEGIMYPGSESDYDNGLAALRKVASLDIEQADNSADRGYVPYVWTEATQNKQVFLKVLYVDAPESTRQGLVQPFKLVCKVQDPTIFSDTVLTATTQGSDPTTNGGTSEFPFQFPIQFGASTYSTSDVATNNGDLDGYPIYIKVYGPINSPKISNTTTGEYIQVNTNVASGSILTITYGKDFLTADVDGVSVLSDVTSDSTYFKLKPGGNTIELTGSAFSSGAYVELNYYKGYWPLS